MGRCGKSTRAEILGLVNSETQDREDRQRETERERERGGGGLDEYSLSSRAMRALDEPETNKGRNSEFRRR